ncbi:MAG TPA: helix-turn-helix domain-containing protein [Nitrososphaerales archaeon]|nr:helix-turn-helix domain-containing protein [Nitrososphaerales archaeon]
MSEKTKRILQDLGLTDYEIKAYVTLLAGPGVQASEVSKGSDVPVSKIYEVLSNLERKGWVESQNSRPSKYFPKSPSTALQALRMKMEAELKSNEDNLLSELMPLYEQKEIQERPDIWIIRGDYNIIAKISESIDRCKKELLVVIPSALNSVVELIIPALTNVKTSGVNVRILMSGEISEKSIAKITSLAELRFKENMFGGGVIIDAREVVLLLGTSSESKEALAIWSDHAGLSSFAKTYFEFLWKEAAPPKKD